MNPIRRAILAAPLALPLLARGAAAQPAAAPSAPGPAQVPSFYRVKVGRYTVTAVSDGSAFRANPTRGMVVNATPEQVEQALVAAHLPVAGFSNPFVSVVVEGDGKKVLFDSGTGGQLTPTAGLLEANLRAAGYAFADFDTVAITHFHADHISGLTTRENAVVFPRAEILVPAAEWAWWGNEANVPRTPEAQRGNFANTARRFAPYRARMRELADGAAILPGIAAVATHGHTPGHMSFHVSDAGQSLFICGDAVNRPEVFLPRPDWHFVFDVDGPMASASRKRLFGRAADERAMVIAYHFPFPGFGHVARAGEGFRYVPVDWSSAV